jgi:hypothetical protein
MFSPYVIQRSTHETKDGTAEKYVTSTRSVCKCMGFKSHDPSATCSIDLMTSSVESQYKILLQCVPVSGMKHEIRWTLPPCYGFICALHADNTNTEKTEREENIFM